MRVRWISGSCLALSLLSLAGFARTRGQARSGVGKAGAAAQRQSEPQAPPPLLLEQTGAFPFSLPAPMVVTGSPHTDREGNVYLICSSFKPNAGPVPNTPPDPASLPITKLSVDSRSAVEYPPQTAVDGYSTFWRTDFNLDIRGALYALYQVQVSLPTGEKQPWESVILKFNSDGSVESTIRLDNPPSGAMLPYHFAVFGDGSFLVTGIVNQAWPGLSQRGGTTPGARPFTGVYDRNGHFAQELTLPDDVGPNPAAAVSAAAETPHAPTGATTTTQGGEGAPGKQASKTPAGMGWISALNFSLISPGPGDTVYLLRASNPPVLYTLFSDGQMLHEARIAPADRFATATGMSPAGQSNLLIDFFGMSVDKEGNAHSTHAYALVDPATGSVVASYKLPSGPLPFFAGADASNHFEFVGSTQDGKLQVVEFSGR